MESTTITIKEVFNQPFFIDQFKLEAGAQGVNKTLGAVSVMEVSDFINFDLGDDLFVLTTFSFCTTGLCDMVDIFKDLTQQNISGILVKLNRYINELPEEIYSIANETGTPLYTLREDIPFRKIISEISKEIISNQMNTIVLMNDMYKNLYRSLINNYTTEKFVEFLDIPEDIHYYVKLEDVTVFDSGMKDEFEISEMTRKIEHNNVESKDASRRYDNYYEVQRVEETLLVFPISGSNYAFGKIVVETTDRPLTNLEIMAFTQLASYMSIKLTEHRLSQEEKINNNSRIFNDIIENEKMTHEKALNLLQLGGYGNYAAYRLIYVSIDISAHSPFEVLKNKYLSVFNEEAENRFISLHSNGFCIIYGKRNKIQKENELFSEFIQRLRKIFDKENLEYKFGISNIFDDYEEVSEAYNQAETTAFISSKISQYTDSMYYDDVWEIDMVRILSQSTQIQELHDQVITPLIEYDQTHQLDLLGTLGESIRTDSLKEVSNNLYIHTTTLRYRYTRIEEITGYDFLTNKGKFVLTCAYFIYMLGDQ